MREFRAGAILHSAQLDHSTMKHHKFHRNRTTSFCKSRIHRHQTDTRQTIRGTFN